MKKYFSIFSCFLFLFLFKISIAQEGPGGVGTTDGTSALVLWLAADNGVEVDGNDNVTKWVDQSGYGSDAFPDNSTGPFYATDNGISSLNFGPQSQLVINNADALGSAGTFFLVMKEFNGGKAFTMQGGSQKNEFKKNRFYRVQDATDYCYVAASCNGIIPKSHYRVLNARWISNIFSFDFYINGERSDRSKRVVGNPQSQCCAFPDIYLGDNNPLPGEANFRGMVAEFIVYTEYLGDEDFDAVNQYLNCKYSLEAGVFCSNFLPCGQKTDGDAAFPIAVYPNPVSAQSVTVTYYSEQTETAELILMNSMGQRCKEWHVDADRGQNRLDLNTDGLPEGNYLLVIKTPSVVMKESILIIR